MLIHQLHCGSQRRKIEMLARILILAVAVEVSLCQEHVYQLKVQHEHQPQGYQHQYVQVKQQEPAPFKEVQYQATPDSQEHAYSSQSIVHQPVEQQESQENTEQAAPTYEYAPLQPHAVPQHSVQAIRFVPVHQTQTVQVPEHRVEVQSAAQAYAKTHQEAQLHPVPIYHPKSHSHDEPIDYYAHPKYQYEYKVEDPHTGDNKFQHEVRDGDVVKGVYSFHEADGSIRIVEYTSDKHNGFNAVVKHTAPGQHVHIEQSSQHQ
ncbi:putative mediator of RNA polymerase II transcription subunit 12 [Galleria mellonella]|uniref:Mediator of RNA polymerase II transcription subunit 12 n=1 Tax=Galleria mellonella TaxID=7137 RepID=A0A6J3CCE1_GALME|nr:putative mediator of RNA polymerase II transcription subunit 12 [Galleria mellonella]